VPYIVDATGDVWQLYPDTKTGYHIGVVDSTFAQNHNHDWRLIGIEVANIGPLTVGHDGVTLTWMNGQIVYGRLGDPHCPPVVKLPTPYRGITYFAAYPQVQIDATIQLVDSLQKAHGFPRVIPPAAHRFAFDPTYFATYKGVCSHVNFVDNWKWDQAPMHSDAIWNGLKALGFTEAS